ncbi:uncharacterized protein LOC112057450, partial [Bicyclus anynana]|uniref:Uncharacterized protein LOC112057450 n=1 Tax=Bicyclus anynana TaxID=110368 RepID=A0A6J1P766_BICAN
YEAKLISSGTELLCHSEIFEQAWQNVKEIKVNCKNQGPIGKAVIPGGIANKDVHDYKYTQLAEEAFVKYKKEVGATEDHQITIVQASEQVVAGMLTRLDFKVILMTSKTELLCHSEILEQPWLNVKDIKTSCDSESQSHTEEEQLPGGIIEKDVHDHKYTQLAEEAFVKYKKEVGSTEVHQILQIDKVTEQHVAGVNTRMDFYAKLFTSNAVLFCHSEILEQPWLDLKNIDVSCYSENQDPKEETQIPGGIIEKDVNDNKYTQLAEEAFAKYKKEIGSYECHQLLKILKVTEQVVAGFMTKVDFNVRLVLSNDTLFCSSTILEEPGVNQKRIDTICHSVNQEQK